MHPFTAAYPPPQPPTTAHMAASLREEIAFLEERLRGLQHTDCAYEKAMQRTYINLLEVRRGQLAELHHATGNPATDVPAHPAG